MLIYSVASQFCPHPGVSSIKIAIYLMTIPNNIMWSLKRFIQAMHSFWPGFCNFSSIFFIAIAWKTTASFNTYHSWRCFRTLYTCSELMGFFGNVERLYSDSIFRFQILCDVSSYVFLRSYNFRSIFHVRVLVRWYSTKFVTCHVNMADGVI